MNKPFLSQLALVVVLGVPAGDAAAEALTPFEALGKELFFDNISDPPWVSCSSCHAPETGWTGPVAGVNKHGGVYRGAVPTRFGNRKPPSSAYAAFSPILFRSPGTNRFTGGNFWDGRATGERLGHPTADQALGPFLNPVEQNNASKQDVCEQVADSKYAPLFEVVWGPGSLDCSPAGVEQTYDRIGLSIDAYEASTEVNPFSSRFDHFLAGEIELTEQEQEGLELFDEKFCSLCHRMDGADPLFTGFGYANIGTPRNPDNPFYDMDTVLLSDGSPINPEGRDWIDEGLGGFLATRVDYADAAEANVGKHKIPTLRNVAKGFGKGFPKAFMHNGYFKSLESIVHFYNTRDVKAVCPDPFTTEKEALAQDCWPEPEVAVNVTGFIVGDLGMSPEEEAALVAFLKTLSDGFEASPKGNPAENSANGIAFPQGLPFD